MQTVGIICEYNPFHNGHAQQLHHIRKSMPDATVVAVMSEHATQRGELPIADGYVRAEAALRAGVDLVVGLPFPYCSSSAEYFARAGIFILNALGTDILHFGSEYGQLSALKDAADRLYSPEFIAKITAFQSSNPSMGILECRQMVYEQQYGLPLPQGSNDLLGMAYLHALRELSPHMQAMTIKREGQRYNDDTCPDKQTLPSATALRTLWFQDGLATLQPHLPLPVFEALCQAEQQGLAPILPRVIDAAILTYFRLSDPIELVTYAGMQNGLAQRLCAAAREAADFDTFWSAIRTKRYTDARLRRSILYALCRVKEDLLRTPPAYVRLLAANAKGCDALAKARKQTALPIVTKPADLPTTGAALAQRACEKHMEGLLSLALPTPKDAGFLLRHSPLILK